MEDPSDAPASRGRTFEARVLQAPGVREATAALRAVGRGVTGSRAQTQTLAAAAVLAARRTVGRVSARQGLLSKGSGGSDAGGAGVGGGRLLVAVQRAAEKEYRVRRAPAVLAVRPCSYCCFPTCHCWLPGHQVSSLVYVQTCVAMLSKGVLSTAQTPVGCPRLGEAASRQVKLQGFMKFRRVDNDVTHLACCAGASEALSAECAGTAAEN